MNQRYRSAALRDLVQQLRFVPAARRAEQVRRAEQLHDEIDPQAVYPLDYLVYRITRYRHDHDEDVLLVGEAVTADLRLLIDELSRSRGFCG